MNFYFSKSIEHAVVMHWELRMFCLVSCLLGSLIVCFKIVVHAGFQVLTFLPHTRESWDCRYLGNTTCSSWVSYFLDELLNINWTQFLKFIDHFDICLCIIMFQGFYSGKYFLLIDNFAHEENIFWSYLSLTSPFELLSCFPYTYPLFLCLNSWLLVVLKSMMSSVFFKHMDLGLTTGG